MDIITHALVGAATGGAVAGTPGAVLGAVAAVLPDAPLAGPRRPAPPRPYIGTHSGLAAACAAACAALGALAGWPLLVAAGAAYVSHIILDIPTHGPTWAPRILWPWRDAVLVQAQEWEWGNKSWIFGLFWSMAWVALWKISVSLF